MEGYTAYEDDTLFKFEKLSTQPYEKENQFVQMDITIEMNLDLTVIERKGYTFLDLLSDIGGVQSILLSSFSILVGIWNYNYIDDYMASKLFNIGQRSKNKGKN